MGFDRRTAAALAAALALAPAALAQHSFSGNAQTVAVATSTVGAGATLAGPASLGSGVTLRHSVGRGTVATLGSGAVVLDSGLVHLEPILGATPPLLFSIAPAHGHADGGTSATLTGFRIAVGSQVPQVAFGGAPGALVAQGGPHQVTVTTPVGRGALVSLLDGAPIAGNPLGAVDVTLANSNGTGVLPAGYRYTPSLEGVGAAVLGQSAQVLAHGQPGELSIISYGLPNPGLGLPIAGVSGALELLPFVTLESRPVAAGAPAVATHLFPLPDEPQLAGLLVPLQTALVGPSGAAFSHVHLLELVLP